MKKLAILSIFLFLGNAVLFAQNARLIPTSNPFNAPNLMEKTNFLSLIKNYEKDSKFQKRYLKDFKLGNYAEQVRRIYENYCIRLDHIPVRYTYHLLTPPPVTNQNIFSGFIPNIPETNK